MKTSLVLAIPFVLAACGHQTPDESDITSGLENLTGHCEFLKFSDVKKLNGRDLGNGEYQVQQEFTLELSPLREFTSEAKDFLKIANDYVAIQQRHTALINEAKEASAESEKKLNAEYEQKIQAINRESDENHNTPERAALTESLMVGMESLRAQLNLRINELAKAKTVESEQHQLSKLNQAASFLTRVRAAHDAKCPNINKEIKPLIFKLVGSNGYLISDNGSPELEAFANGVKKTFTENNVTYVKTERGWMRSN